MSCHVLSSWLRMWSHVLSKISSWVPTRCILAVWRGQWPNRKSSIQPDHNHLIIFLSLKLTLQRQTFWVGNNLHEHSYDMFWLTSKVFVVNHDIYIYIHIYTYIIRYYIYEFVCSRFQGIPPLTHLYCHIEGQPRKVEAVTIAWENTFDGTPLDNIVSPVMFVWKTE